MASSRRPTQRPSYQSPSSRAGSGSSYQSSGRDNSILKSGLLIALGVFMTACIGLSFVAYQRADTCLNGSMRDCLGLPTPTPSVSVGGILTKLSGASELVTAVAESETRVKLEQAENFLGLFDTGRSINLEYQAYGTIMTSIDLSQITERDVHINNNLVTVNLPPPKILSTAIDVDRSYVANVQKPFLALNDPDPRLVNYAQQEAQKAMLEDACAKGILDQANVHAAQTLRELLEQVSPLPIQIITQPGICR
jgi:hypothetical protein